MNILIFGGTFDPIHNAHLDILSITQKQFSIDKTIIVPSKNVVYKKIDADQIHRYNMVKLATQHLSNIEVSDYEIKQNANQPSYSIQTIKHYLAKYPRAKFYMLIGADQLAYFSQWKSHHEISKLCQILVYQRDGIIIDKLLIQHRAIAVNGQGFYLASSSLKLQLPKSDGLNKDVYQYILSHALYTEYWILKLMGQRRYEHSLRVADLAKQTMNIYNPSLTNAAWVAGMYHDITKEFKYETAVEIATSLNISQYHPKVWHGLIASHYLQTLGFSNHEILNAIARHTVPSMIPGPITLLDKVLYCADKLEIERTNDDLVNINDYRQLLNVDINQCYEQLINYYAHINEGKK